MKKGSLILKLIAAALCCCLIVTVFAACGAGKTVMSLEKDGKVYTISESEFSILMKIEKLDVCCSALIRRQDDKLSLWETKNDEGKTYEELYKARVIERTKSILAEKYLFEKNGLTLSSDTMDSYKSQLKDTVRALGGIGSYKQYYGYTDTEYYENYVKMVARSQAVMEALYGENGEQKVTAEDLEAFYKDNYVGYQFIVIDLENKVKLDGDGKRVVTVTKDKDGKEVPGDSFETEKLTDEEKQTKQLLAKVILDELKAGATFDDMVSKYSEDYYSLEYPDGMFIPKQNTFINDEVTKKAGELEIGEYTEEAISVDGAKFQYIVKKVALKDKVYEDEKYESLFEGYADSVKYDKYNTFIETFFEQVNVVEEVAGKYTFADTFLSKYADVYYNQYLSQFYSAS